MNTITLYWADCREILAKLDDNSIDTIFVDPQYGTGNAENKTPHYDQSEYMASRHWNAFHAEWDAEDVDDVLTYQWLYEARRVLRPKGSLFCCGTFHNIPTTAVLAKQVGFYTNQWIQWVIPNSFPHLAGKKMANANQTVMWLRKSDKAGSLYNYDRAKAWNGGKNLRDFWRLDYTDSEWQQFFAGLNECWMVVYNSTKAVREMQILAEFKAKKPYELIARCLDLTLPVDRPSTVIDFFLGSGTTARVVQHINDFIPIPREQPIDFIGVEKSRENIERFISPRLGVAAIEGPGGTA